MLTSWDSDTFPKQPIFTCLGLVLHKWAGSFYIGPHSRHCLLDMSIDQFIQDNFSVEAVTSQGIQEWIKLTIKINQKNKLSYICDMKYQKNKSECRLSSVLKFLTAVKTLSF